MASGSFKTNVVTAAGSGYYRQIEVVWSSTNDTTNNKSTVSWSAYSRCPDSDNTVRYVNAWNITVTINGTAKNINGSTTKKLTKNLLIGSGSVTIAHGSDGRKTGVPVAISASIWDSSKTNATYSGTINLDPNPVYTLNLTGQGSNTTIAVSRTSSAGAGSIGTISNGAMLYYGDVLRISASAASNFQLKTLKVNGSNFTSGNTHTVSGDVSVTTTAQALASVISVGSASTTLGGSIAITVTKYNSNYAHSISWSFAGHSGYVTSTGGTQSGVAKYTNTSVTFSIPTTWGDYIPSASTGVCTLTCKTYETTSSSTQLGSSTTASFNVLATSGSSGPQITLHTVADTNSTTLALTGSSSRLIKYMSNAECKLSASARHGATLKTATMSGVSVMPSGSSSPTTITEATRTFSSVTTSSFSFEVSDSRGYTASYTTTSSNVVLIDYVMLTCNPEVKRPSGTSTSANLKVSGAFYNGAFNAAGTNTNTLSLSYMYKENDSSVAWPTTWTAISASSITKTGSTYTTSSITIDGNFDYQKTYVFRIKAEDGVGNNKLTSITKEILMPTGRPVFDWGQNTFNFNVGITFEDQQQTTARGIYFRNDMDLDDVEHPHSVSITGGSPSSERAVQLYDHNNSIAPIVYTDDPIRLMFYAKSGELAYSYLADFVNEVKYDTTTGLYYRKYYSGIAEVWGNITVSPTGTSTTGSLYYSNAISLPLPITFLDATANVSVYGNYMWAVNVRVTNSSSSSIGSGDHISFNIMRGVALASTYSPPVGIHIIGKMSGYSDRTYDEGGTPTPARAGGVSIRTETDPESGGIVKHITGVDLSNDTVDAAHLAQGYTAHDKNGNAITGELT